ncbi:MAG TPA: hypothetical protein PK006_05875 [Saprospiraceae bacterium]|nr:hypothetical protein [Saprospiraceae bacterium]
MNNKAKKIIAAGIGLVFLSSLTMECYLVDGDPSLWSRGVIALLLGWLNFNKIGLIWLANPLFIFSYFIFLSTKKSKLALAFSSVASILALSFTQIESIIKNEGGYNGQITEYLLGYWLWVGSILLLLVSLILNEILQYNKPTAKAAQ